MKERSLVMTGTPEDTCESNDKGDDGCGCIARLPVKERSGEGQTD